MESTSSFGYWVRRRRKALDLTQDELARRVGCAVDTIKKIEVDARRPSKDLADRLADCLQVASTERPAFLQAARAERAADRLALPSRPIEQDPPDLPDHLPSMALPHGTAEQERSVFVGRERELAWLDTHLTAVLAGDGRVVFVTGEAGDGKTALLAEFARRAQAAQPGLVVASGACTAYAGMGDPYLPFRDILTMLSGEVEARWEAGALTAGQAQRLRQVWPQTVEALAAHGPDLMDLFVPRTTLARHARPHYPAGTGPFDRWQDIAERRGGEAGRLEQHQLFEQFTNVLRAIAARQPLLVLLDDLQWADAATINLLFHLGRRLAGSRMLVLGAYRLSEVALGRATSTDRVHPLKPVVNELTRHFGEIQLDLGSATTSEGRRFVDALLDSEPNLLGEGFRASLFGRTHGQALFTIELLRVMEERGDIVRDADGRWVEGRTLAWDAVPARVEAVIKQRMDRLDETQRELLTVASVEGEEFTAQVVARVQSSLGRSEANVTEWQVLRLAQELSQRHRLVRERGEVSVGDTRLSRYQFSHGLFQQYLYHQLSLGERRVLHHALAESLEHLYSDRLDELAAVLAHHYSTAGYRDRSVDYSRRAARRAVALYAYDEAVRHLDTALAFLASGEQSALHLSVVEELADVHRLLHQGLRAIALYREALNLGRDSKHLDNETTMRLHRKIVQTVAEIKFSIDLGDLEAASEIGRVSQAWLEAKVQKMESEPPHPETIRILTTLSIHAWNVPTSPDWEAAHRYAQAAVAMAEHLDDPVGLSAALGTLATLYFGHGWLREYERVSLRRLTITQAARFTDPHEQVESLREAGSALMYVGKYRQAIIYLQEAESLAKRIHAVDQQFNALALQSQCWFRLDRWDDVLEAEGKWRDLERRYGRERIGQTCFAIAIGAMIHGLRGESDLAQTLQEESYTHMVAWTGVPAQWIRNQHY